MAVVKLTKRLVEEATPGQTDICLWDSGLPRFGVVIKPSGRRAYIVQYRVRRGSAPKPLTRRIHIGAHGRPWTLEQAREQARGLLARVDLGGDPFGEREANRRASAAAEEASAREANRREHDRLDRVVELYTAQRLRKLRTGGETARLLQRDVLPVWGQRQVSEIRRSDLACLVDAIDQRSAAVARATYAALRGFFFWCLERDLIDRSPCEGYRAPPRPRARDRVLEEEELPIIWEAAERLAFPFGPLVQLLMLTGQRRGEVAGMMWRELDLQAGVWRIPKERTKNAKAHEVDLSPRALRILRALERDGPCVFPARNNGSVRGFSAAKRKLDRLVEEVRLEQGSRADWALEWRIHDLRRTAATGMAGLGFGPHVIERVLNHISGVQGGLVGVYQRHEYRPDRRAALLGWAAHLEGLVGVTEPSSNVVALRGRGSVSSGNTGNATGQALNR